MGRKIHTHTYSDPVCCWLFTLSRSFPKAGAPSLPIPFPLIASPCAMDFFPLSPRPLLLEPVLSGACITQNFALFFYRLRCFDATETTLFCRKKVRVLVFVRSVKPAAGYTMATGGVGQGQGVAHVIKSVMAWRHVKQWLNASPATSYRVSCVTIPPLCCRFLALCTLRLLKGGVPRSICG